MRIQGLLLGCLLLTACTPRIEEKGRVIVGRDEFGVLLAYVGFCSDDNPRSITISDIPQDNEPGSSISIVNYEPDGVAIVDLLPDKPPERWHTRDQWSLPKLFTTSGSTSEGSGTSISHQMVPPTTVDMDNIGLLPEDAEDLAEEDC